jgi:SSS family solute:Na+ symporter
VDRTAPDDYFADEGDPRLEKARTSPEEVGSST